MEAWLRNCSIDRLDRSRTLQTRLPRYAENVDVICHHQAEATDINYGVLQYDANYHDDTQKIPQYLRYSIEKKVNVSLFTQSHLHHRMIYRTRTSGDLVCATRLACEILENFWAR